MKRFIGLIFYVHSIVVTNLYFVFAILFNVISCASGGLWVHKIAFRTTHMKTSFRLHHVIVGVFSYLNDI